MTVYDGKFNRRHLVRDSDFERLQAKLKRQFERGFVQVGNATRDHDRGEWIAVVEYKGRKEDVESVGNTPIQQE